MIREMKDSGVKWIGEIPSNWNLKKLKMVADTITDFVASGSFASLRENVEYLDQPDYAMLVRTIDLSNKINKEKVYVSKESYDFLRNSNLYGGEIILPNIGSIGDVYYYRPLYKKSTLAPNSILVRMNSSNDNKFFYYYFSSSAGETSLLNLGSNAVQSKFNKTQLRQLQVPVPPLEMQKKIVDFLDVKVSQINEIITKSEQSIEELKKYKLSIITETITKGLNPNVAMKESGIEWIGKVPDSWTITKVNNLFSIKKEIANEIGYDVLSVTQRGLKVKDVTQNEGQMAADYSKYQIVQPDDFVMNHMDLLTGWVDISSQEGVTSPDYRVFYNKQKEIVFNKYYLYVFQICYSNKIFYGLGQGVSNFGRWRLQTDKFLNFYLPLPSKEEQKEIVSYLDEQTKKIGALIRDKEKIIAELKRYKKSFIYEYVTGKKEV